MLDTLEASLSNECHVLLSGFFQKEACPDPRASDINLHTICELRDKYPHLKVELWKEGYRLIPEWGYHFKDDIHNFIDGIELKEYFLDDLIDAVNWVCALDKKKKEILEDFAETLEVHSNYISGAVSIIDLRNEVLLLRNVIIRFHDEHKSWYHADDKILKTLYEATNAFDDYEEFMESELDDFMKDHVWNKVVQLMAHHLQKDIEDDVQYREYLTRIKSLTGRSIDKLYQLRDIINGIPVPNTVMIDGKEVSCLMEVVWRNGFQLICKWKQMSDFLV